MSPPGRALGRALLDLLAPCVCAACKGPVTEPGRSLCWDCTARVGFVTPPFCRHCGMPVAGRVDLDYTCSLCSAQPPAYARCRVAARFDGPAREMIHALKYQRATWLAPELGRWLGVLVQTYFHDMALDAIIPTPLFPRRQRERGYNQSDLLAREASRVLGVPVWSRALRRVRDTRSQTGLTAPERLSNVHAAFHIPHPERLEGRCLLCIDDVMTTGATLDACSRALREAGAQQVAAAAVARG